MENNIFKQLCGKINYNTYKNIQNTLWFSGVGLILTNDLISQRYPILNKPIDILYYSTIVANLVMNWSHGEKYTKDIIQIRELYEEFIKNYNKLNKIFDLNDPVQIYAMFNYLLYKGYLSKDKNFEFASKPVIDINELLGINVITGKAVCRHISSMLTNILNDYGIESGKLIACSNDYEIKIINLDKQKYTKEELINWANTHIRDESTHEDVIKLIDEFDKLNENIEISSETIKNKNVIDRIIGNHMISFAFKDDKSYFLDPTQTRIYRLKESDKKILYDEICEFPIKLDFSITCNNSKDFKNMKEKILKRYPSIPKDTEKLMINETLDTCNNNIDIFERFYNENSELYNDITDKVLKIKKKPL